MMNASIRKACKALLLVLFATAAVHCSDDKETASISFSAEAVYISDPATTTTIRMQTYNAASVSVFAYPEGWTVVPDLATGIVSITSPAADDEDAEYSGTVTIYAYPQKGSAGSGSFFVSRSQAVDLSAEQSNCFILPLPQRNYTFPIRKGDSNERLDAASVKIVWQSDTDLVTCVEKVGETVSLYIPGEDGELVEGNALLAACDQQGTIIWTWHLWITDYTPLSEGIFMSRNLGAAANGHADTDEILASYGLYYQWGRKTPFIGPSTYDCASAADAYLYNASNALTYVDYEESSETTGTAEYAEANPLSFLLGVEESGYDWLYAAHDATRWSTRKTLEDPCPKGWRVPVGSELSALAFTTPPTQEETAELLGQYGWNLSQGGHSSFFLGGGRRSALYGTITNMNTNETPKPWIGCYWSSSTPSTGLDATALYFTLDSDDASLSQLQPDAAYARANGMQIRCVKE